MNYMDLSLSLIALIILEIVLGIDNLVLLSILSEKLPKHQQKKARRLGLTFAWVSRLMLLAAAVWMVKLTKPLLQIGNISFSWRDLFLLAGGAFLIAKATQEIHNEVGEESEIITSRKGRQAKFTMVVMQIAILDIIFSLDSVLTAIGLTQVFWVMALAITIAILIMIFASEWVARFIANNPTIKILALSFLMMIGMILIADGLSFHVPRGYIYFAMGFSLGVEGLNNLSRRKRRVS